MKLPPFAYLRPRDIAETCAMLRANPGAKLLAGGQSLLVQLMNEVVRPATLIDINNVTDFPLLALQGGTLVVGALTRHAELAGFADGMAQVPLLALALRHVAHPAIRNRGTICGSLAYADPAAELPAAALLLDAKLTMASQDGIRQVAARDFFSTPFATACRSDEIVIQVAFPAAGSPQFFGMIEIGTRSNDPASIGVMLCADIAKSRAALVLFGAGLPRVLCDDLMFSDASETAAAALLGVAPAISRARLLQAKVLTERALKMALAENLADA